MLRTCTARWVFPVSGPPLAHGTVTVGGDRIEAVEPHGTRTPDEDFGNAAIVPGLVNPHTHLDLSGARGLIPPTDPDHFTDWLRGVIGFRRTRTAEQTQADIRTGLAECTRFGTTLIGDIASEGASWDALAEANTRAVVFREIIGLTRHGVERWNEAVQWAKDRNRERCKAGYSPHAPYSVNAAVLMRSVEVVRPVTIHLAESPAEVELLAHRRGPFVEFLRQLGIWDGAVLAESLDWVLSHTSHAGTRRPVLYVHCNYLPWDTLFRRHTSVCYCPRTHAAFGHPPHPFREFLARGVRVCLGTDSLASNPDLDVLAEARFVRSRHPDFPGDQLLRMVTLSGAEALGWADEAGSLEAGKSADFVVVPLPNADAADPHELLFAEHAGERRTMFRGAWRA
jgi:cytosine/adenosine deaminase-related metal-dependent hydrolase